MEGDARSRCVVLLAECYVNPAPGGLDGLAVAQARGWGVIQLPAECYSPELSGRLLAEIAEQAEEYQRHGYHLAIVGHRDGLDQSLAGVGLALPALPRPGDGAQVSEFLARHEPAR